MLMKYRKQGNKFVCYYENNPDEIINSFHDETVAKNWCDKQNNPKPLSLF
jgi:hypothetical protein